VWADTIVALMTARIVDESILADVCVNPRLYSFQLDSSRPNVTGVCPRDILAARVLENLSDRKLKVVLR
jgi:hypothetical protein